MIPIMDITVTTPVTRTSSGFRRQGFPSHLQRLRDSFQSPTYTRVPRDRVSFRKTRSLRYPGAGPYASTSTPPSPRLVGVETNPGPKARKSRVPKRLKAAPIAKRARARPKAIARVPPMLTANGATVSRRTGPHRAQPQLTNYLKCLADPWGIGPIRLGWGCYGPSGLHTAFKKFAITPAASTNCLAIVFQPDDHHTPGNAVSDGFVSIYENTTSGSNTDLASFGTTQSYGAANETYLNSCVDYARMVAGAMRVTVRYAATATRGQIGGILFPREQKSPSVGAGVCQMSPDGLMALSAARWGHSDAAGQVGVEVQYRPCDSRSFEFRVAETINGTEQRPHQVVVLTGWPAGTFTVEIELIAHYETLSGTDSGGDDYSPGDTVAGAGVSSDLAGAEASRLQPVITDLDNVTMLDAALENARKSGARTGMTGFGARASGVGVFPSRDALPNGSHGGPPQSLSSGPILGASSGGYFHVARGAH